MKSTLQPAFAWPLRVLAALCAEPADPALGRSVPRDVSIESYSLENGELTLSLSEGYLSLEGMEKTLTDYCITLSVVGIDAAHGIRNRPRKLLDRRDDAVQLVGPFAGDLMVLRHLPEVSAGRYEKIRCRSGRTIVAIGHVAAIARERRSRGIRRLHDLRRMRRSGMARRKGIFVVIGQLRCIDLLDRIAQSLDLVSDIHRALKRRPARPQLGQRPPDCLVVRT